MDIHLYHHLIDDRSASAGLLAITRKLNHILDKQDRIMATLAELTAQVAANSTVIDSALVLISGIAARIEAAGTNPVALDALVAELQAKDTELAAAVAANTPAA